MIEDFDRHPDGAAFDVDVCVVGAGPVGIAVAREFAGTSTSVLVVETGGLDPAPETERLNDGETTGLPLPTLLDGRTRAFGGATKLWPGQCVRLDDGDLAARDWVPDSGWPITAADLLPYYRRAEDWFAMGDGAFDERAWERFGLTPPAFDGDRLVHKSSVYTPFPDTGSHLQAEFAGSANVRVLLHATVVRVHAAPDGAVGAVDLRALDGRSGTVRAGAVVLAGGGVENARTLLVSGLGNEHDTVGRWFHEHPALWVDLDVDRPDALQKFYGRLGRRTIRYLPKIRLAPRVQREQRVLNGVADVIYELAEPRGRAAARELSSALQGRRLPRGLGAADLAGAARELGPVALAAFRRFAQGRPSPAPLTGARLKILMEQAPNRDSRITLSDERDALGTPKARVDWRLTELDRRTAEVLTSTLDTEFRRLGLARLRDLDRLAGDGWTDGVEEACHHMGTTRMSVDPRSGVVDPDLQVHGVPGLYACGSSVFPTGGYANPTLTIVALALRLADHLKVTLRHGSRPDHQHVTT
jgi:choline dehydrogenase-like flavoprotein